MEKTFQTPSRKGLLLGAALVALHGQQQERITQARHFGCRDFMQHPDVVRCVKAMDDLRAGRPIQEADEGISGVLASAYQLMRVSLDEWETVVQFAEEQYATN